MFSIPFPGVSKNLTSVITTKERRAATAFLAISEQWVSKLVSKNCLIT